MSGNGAGFTAKLASFICATRMRIKIPQWAYEHAKVAFMDWLAVTFAGKDDPLVVKLMDYTDMMGGNEQATIIGYHRKKDVSSAALINGSASHALDYDDTLVSFLGHPSVTIFPSLLALSEWRGKSGKDFLTAYLIGLQAGGTVGACASLDHYMAGWHATSTLGHLASAAACSRLLGLTRDADRVCARHRRHSGLRAQTRVRDHVQAIPCRPGFPVRAHGGPSGREGFYQCRGHS